MVTLYSDENNSTTIHGTQLTRRKSGGALPYPAPPFFHGPLCRVQGEGDQGSNDLISS